MDKEKYLKELEKRLEYLTAEQKQQEIFRVSNELDSGKVMNDLSNEVNQIYEKYKINPAKKKKVQENAFLSAFSNLIDHMGKNNWKDNLTIIKDIIVIIIIVSLLKIPFIGLENLLFYIGGSNLTDKMYTVFNFFIEVIYYIFALYMLIRLFRRRFKKEMKLK